MLVNSGDITDRVLDLESGKKKTTQKLGLKKGMQMSSLARMPWPSKPIRLIPFPVPLPHEVYLFL